MRNEIKASSLKRLSRYGGAVSEVSEQSAVEAVEDDKMGLVGELLALPRPATEHLLETGVRSMA